MKKIISPEAISKIKNKNILKKYMDLFFGPVIRFLTNIYFNHKYRENSYDKKFNWDWNELNYNRIALVNYLITKIANPKYLEIGCHNNALFNSVAANTKIGVDPLMGGTLKMTSDEFFCSNSDKFDIIFIDGLHTFQQIRKDINNSFNSLTNNGYILIHDMLPRDWKEQHIPIISNAWTGDVWKVAYELINTKGIDFKILSIDHGVGVIKILKQGNILPNLENELKDKKFEFYYKNIDLLPILSWDDYQALSKNN